MKDGKCAFVAFCACLVLETMGTGDPLKDVLAAPVVPNQERMAWNAMLAEVARCDEAADARWAACGDAAAVKALQDELALKMRAAIGGLPERCALNAVVTETVARDGYRIEKVYFESQPKLYETGLFYRPAGDGPFPAVAVTCGHSGNGKGSEGYQRACVLAAQAGIAAFIYDPIDQGERKQMVKGPDNVHGHNQIGTRAALLGWSMARFRIWDAMRALDYLASRSDVDASRLGLMGNSGGGTLTSLTMALDPRIQAAAPSCYLSTLRAVCADCGPQDAEQNIFGQLAFGLNHLGYVALRAPKPTLMVTKDRDFFPIRGSRATREVAQYVFAVAGAEDAYAMFTAPGPHGWVESTRMASVAWMRRWLKDERDSFRPELYAGFVAKDDGFDLKKVDFGLNPGYEVAPMGNVRNLPGAVTAYDMLRAEAKRAASAWKGRPEAATVRRVADIRTTAVGQLVKGKEQKTDAFTATPWKLEFGGMVLSAVALRPAVVKGVPVLVLPSDGRVSALEEARTCLAAGHAVLVADLRGFGETGRGGRRFYGSAYPEEGVAAMAYLLGRNLVSLRAEDAIQFARAWAAENDCAKVDVKAIGRAAIPAAHAAAAVPALFGEKSFVQAPPSWSVAISEENLKLSYTDIVNGALRTYDWTDL